MGLGKVDQYLLSETINFLELIFHFQMSVVSSGAYLDFIIARSDGQKWRHVIYDHCILHG